jgi:hypothetical protein
MLVSGEDTIFSNFHAKFRQLAMRAAIPAVSWQDDVCSKLPYELQRSLAIRITIHSFDELVNIASDRPSRLKKIDERQNRGRTPRNRSNLATTASAVPDAPNARVSAGERAHHLALSTLENAICT